MFNSLKNHFEDIRIRISTFYRILNFYTSGLRQHIVVLIFFSMLVGLLESLQILLIYPILNASFNLPTDGFPIFYILYDVTIKAIDVPEIVAFCIILICFVLLAFLTTIFYRYLALQFTKKIIVNLKKSTFNKLQTSDYNFFVNNNQGDVLYNMISSPTKINIFLDYCTRMLSDTTILILIVGSLLLFNFTATIFLIIGGICFVLLYWFIGSRFSYFIGKTQLNSISSENTIVTQYIMGIRQIRSSYADNYWKKQYVGALSNYWDKYVHFRFIEQIPSTLLNTFFHASIGIVCIILYYLYPENFHIVLPLFGTFAFAALKVLPRIQNFGSNYMVMMDAYPDLERIFVFLNNNQYHKIKNGVEVFTSLKSNIYFNNIFFNFEEKQDLIKDLSLTIQKNKMTAIVGHSGSGKSTLVSLLLRFYDVTNGNILVNDIDLREYDISTFLAKVGYVSQDTFIYNASVRDNITFGGSYTEKEIIAAAKMANIHSFISSLPEGYNTIVGDQGLKLSGGEKQRIAITRALVREPEILVLDEATSNLDNESEAIVQESINQVSQTVTTLIVAHRLSTIRRADTIYVMSRGRVVESGGHEELMEKKGKYYELYNRGG